MRNVIHLIQLFVNLVEWWFELAFSESVFLKNTIQNVNVIGHGYR